jgi:FtsZ-binding cell division protein ZapB
MRNNGLAGLVVAIVLSLSLAACKDTKTLQENGQLKAQVAELQKENTELGNNIQSLKVSQDALTKENETLKAEVRTPKKKRPATKASVRKRRRASRPSSPARG